MSKKDKKLLKLHRAYFILEGRIETLKQRQVSLGLKIDSLELQERVKNAKL